MKVEKYLEEFTLLHPKSIDLSLDRILALLNKLGNPQNTLPPVIHVGGTNGKGSVVTYIRSILVAAGYQVQAYTSPHLIRFNERIRLANGLIHDDWLKELFSECNFINAGAPITFFEITTVAAFLAFSRSPADVLVVEVGLGGRLDTTNTINKPILTAITPISLDHTGFIGNTLEAIAREKAGILKRNVPLVLAEQSPNVKRIILDRALDLNVPTSVCGEEWNTQVGDGKNLLVQLGQEQLDLPLPSLKGPHQIANAGQAIACIRNLDGFSINTSAMGEGISNTVWPGRLQALRDGPVKQALPTSCEVWLDSAHNADASKALAKSIEFWDQQDRRLTFFIVAMMRTKDIVSFIEPIRHLAYQLVAVPVPGEDTSHKPRNICNVSHDMGINTCESQDIFSAMSLFSNSEKIDRARVMICGSIYFCGTVLKLNQESIN